MPIHHIAFRTADLERLAGFYAGVFGLAETRRGRDEGGLRSVWFDLGGAVLMLERASRGEPSVAAGSMEFIALAVEPAALASWRERFERAGVAIEASTEFTLYVRDPDGRRVGVSSYREPVMERVPVARR